MRSLPNGERKGARAPIRVRLEGGRSRSGTRPPRSGSTRIGLSNSSSDCRLDAACSGVHGQTLPPLLGAVPGTSRTTGIEGVAVFPVESCSLPMLDLEPGWGESRSRPVAVGPARVQTRFGMRATRGESRDMDLGPWRRADLMHRSGSPATARVGASYQWSTHARSAEGMSRQQPGGATGDDPKPCEGVPKREWSCPMRRSSLLRTGLFELDWSPTGTRRCIATGGGPHRDHGSRSGKRG